MTHVAGFVIDKADIIGQIFKLLTHLISFLAGVGGASGPAFPGPLPGLGGGVGEGQGPQVPGPPPAKTLLHPSVTFASQASSRVGGRSLMKREGVLKVMPRYLL